MGTERVRGTGSGKSKNNLTEVGNALWRVMQKKINICWAG